MPRSPTGQTTRERKRAKRECRRFVAHLRAMERLGYRNPTEEEAATFLPVGTPDDDGDF